MLNQRPSRKAAPQIPEKRLLGYLHGQGADGSHAVVGVYKAGGDYQLTSAGQAHICLPSVEDMDGVKREAFQVYGIWNWVFQPASAEAS